MKHLIWSNEDGRWWGAYRRGYVTIISQAGRYSPEIAKQFCDDANACIGKDQEPRAVAVIAPECVGLIDAIPSP